MKTRINVYGLTFVAIIVFFAYGQKWKYDHDREMLSQLNQALKLDESRFSILEALSASMAFDSAVKGTYSVDSKVLQKEAEQKHKAELDSDHRRIEEFSRDHGL